MPVVSCQPLTTRGLYLFHLLSGRASREARPARIEVRNELWQSADMDREQVITTLREHEAELKSEGVTRLCLFGSVARGDSNSQSDIDLMAEFDASREYSILDRVRLKHRLGDILGVEVDLAPVRAMKDEVRRRATRESVLAF